MIAGSKRLFSSSSMHFSLRSPLCLCVLLITSGRLQGLFVWFFSLCSSLCDMTRAELDFNGYLVNTQGCRNHPPLMCPG